MLGFFGDNCWTDFVLERGGRIVGIDEKSTLIILGMEKLEAIFRIGNDQLICSVFGFIFRIIDGIITDIFIIGIRCIYLISKSVWSSFCKPIIIMQCIIV